MCYIVSVVKWNQYINPKCCWHTKWAYPACVKPEKWAIMYLYVRGISCASFYDFDISFWKCSDSSWICIVLVLWNNEVNMLLQSDTLTWFAPTSLCSFSFLLRAQRRRRKYQCHRLWLAPNPWYTTQKASTRIIIKEKNAKLSREEIVQHTTGENSTNKSL